MGGEGSAEDYAMKMSILVWIYSREKRSELAKNRVEQSKLGIVNI